MTTFLLQHPLQNHRGYSESFAAYKRRRKNGNKLVDRYLKGRLTYTATEIVGPLPLTGVDAKVDRAILTGQLREPTLHVNRETGEQFRMARTKGVPFRHPKGRAVGRACAVRKAAKC